MSALRRPAAGWLAAWCLAALSFRLGAAAVEFSESHVIVGAPFRLDIPGANVSSRDRIFIRDAGTGCPGAGDTSPSMRSSSIALASVIIHNDGTPPDRSPTSPVVGRSAVTGKLTASFFPMQLRWRGAFRICYCTATDLDGGTGTASPCDVNTAPFQFAGAVYAMTMEYSGTPLATCAVGDDGVLLRDCTFTVQDITGGLSDQDVATLILDGPQALCGEGPPLGKGTNRSVGDAYQRTLTIAAGLRVMPNATSRVSNAQLAIQVCYCERNSIPSWDTRGCGTGADWTGNWQNAGKIALAGFAGFSMGGQVPQNSLCYRDTFCDVQRGSGFGLSDRDMAVSMVGSGCANRSGATGVPWPTIIRGDTSATTMRIDLTSAQGWAVVCYCPQAAITCGPQEASRFPVILGFVRVSGLRQVLNISCLPSARTCPETPTGLASYADQQAATRGRLLAALPDVVPCSAVGFSNSWQAKTFGASIDLQWPLLPGRYTLCFCDVEIGCPSEIRPAPVRMQYVGELVVLGLIRNVSIWGKTGIASIPVAVELVNSSQGIQCCAYDLATVNATAPICGEVEAVKPAQVLPGPGLYVVHLVQPSPRPAGNPGRYNVTCRAAGEQGRCAGPDSPCEMPLGGLQVQLAPVPAAWSGPWSAAAGARAGVETVAAAADPGAWMKLVPRNGTDPGDCSGPADVSAAAGLPCKGDACNGNHPAMAVISGSYSLCICEVEAVAYYGDCAGWHELGGYEIFGPLPWPEPQWAALPGLQQLRVRGNGLSEDDSLAVWPSPADGSEGCGQPSSTGELEALPARTQIRPPWAWSSSELSFNITLTEGAYVVCWLPPHSAGALVPVYIGSFTVLNGGRQCVVSDWRMAGPCEALCGAGPQQWTRDVVTPPLGPVKPCPALNETRVCHADPCPEVDRWEVLPQLPVTGEPFEIRIWGEQLPGDLLLFLLDPGALGHGEPCVPGTEDGAAAEAPGIGFFRREIFSYNHTALGTGNYTLCLCRAPRVRPCAGYYPALGNITIGALEGSTAKHSGDYAIALIVASLASVFCGTLVALVCCFRRRLRSLCRWRCACRRPKAAPAPDKYEKVVDDEPDKRDSRNSSFSNGGGQPEPEPPHGDTEAEPLAGPVGMALDVDASQTLLNKGKAVVSPEVDKEASGGRRESSREGGRRRDKDALRRGGSKASVVAPDEEAPAPVPPHVPEAWGEPAPPGDTPAAQAQLPILAAAPEPEGGRQRRHHHRAASRAKDGERPVEGNTVEGREDRASKKKAHRDREGSHKRSAGGETEAVPQEQVRQLPTLPPLKTTGRPLPGTGSPVPPAGEQSRGLDGSAAGGGVASHPGAGPTAPAAVPPLAPASPGAQGAPPAPATPTSAAAATAAPPSLPNVAEGTVFVATELGGIFVSPRSWEEIGEVSPGDHVVAAGPPLLVEGFVMLPIKPRGAVDMSLLEEVVKPLQPDVQETAQAAPPPGFSDGCRVEVVEDFASDNGQQAMQLRGGQRGTVRQVDEDGDILVDFDDHEEPQWVFAAKRRHLRLVGGESPAPALASVSAEGGAGAAAGTGREEEEEEDLPASEPEREEAEGTRPQEAEAPVLVEAQAAPGSSLAVGDLVAVLEGFCSDNCEDAAELLPGQRGVVLQVDEDGDALIQFDEHKEPQWVFGPNQPKLEVFRVPSEHTVQPAVQAVEEAPAPPTAPLPAPAPPIPPGSPPAGRPASPPGPAAPAAPWAPPRPAQALAAAPPPPEPPEPLGPEPSTQGGGGSGTPAIAYQAEADGAQQGPEDVALEEPPADSPAPAPPPVPPAEPLSARAPEPPPPPAVEPPAADALPLLLGDSPAAALEPGPGEPRAAEPEPPEPPAEGSEPELDEPPPRSAAAAVGPEPDEPPPPPAAAAALEPEPDEPPPPAVGAAGSEPERDEPPPPAVVAAAVEPATYEAPAPPAEPELDEPPPSPAAALVPERLAAEPAGSQREPWPLPGTEEDSGEGSDREAAPEPPADPPPPPPLEPAPPLVSLGVIDEGEDLAEDSLDGGSDAPGEEADVEEEVEAAEVSFVSFAAEGSRDAHGGAELEEAEVDAEDEQEEEDREESSFTSLTEGDRVATKEGFHSDTPEWPVWLHVGQAGIVLQVDEDGNVLVHFDDHEEPQWVAAANLSRLVKLPGGSPHKAFDAVSDLQWKIPGGSDGSVRGEPGPVGSPFRRNSRVVVLEDFVSDSRPPVQLRRGEKGTAMDFDPLGNLLLNLDDHEEPQWVSTPKFEFLAEIDMNDWDFADIPARQPSPDNFRCGEGPMIPSPVVSPRSSKAGASVDNFKVQDTAFDWDALCSRGGGGGSAPSRGPAVPDAVRLRGQDIAVPWEELSGFAGGGRSNQRRSAVPDPVRLHGEDIALPWEALLSKTQVAGPSEPRGSREVGASAPRSAPDAAAAAHRAGATTPPAAAARAEPGAGGGAARRSDMLRAAGVAPAPHLEAALRSSASARPTSAHMRQGVAVPSSGSLASRAIPEAMNPEDQSRQRSMTPTPGATAGGGPMGSGTPKDAIDAVMWRGMPAQPQARTSPPPSRGPARHAGEGRAAPQGMGLRAAARGGDDFDGGRGPSFRTRPTSAKQDMGGAPLRGSALLDSGTLMLWKGRNDVGSRDAGGPMGAPAPPQPPPSGTSPRMESRPTSSGSLLRPKSAVQVRKSDPAGGRHDLV